FGAFLQDKIVPVAGDVTADGLRIAPELRARIEAETEIVVHAAASVFFDERIDHAVAMNTLGPRRLIELTRSFKRPPLFAFVSTAYVSGTRTGRIAEAPPALDFDVEAELGDIARVVGETGRRAAERARAGSFRAEAERLAAAAASAA